MKVLIQSEFEIQKSKELQKFIYYLEFSRNYSINTVLSYSRDLEIFFKFLTLNDKWLNNVNFNDIMEFLYFTQDSMGKRSQARIMSALRHFYRFYETSQKEEVADTQSTSLTLKEVKIKKEGEYLPIILETREVNELIDSIDFSTKEGARNKAMIEMLYSCGLRVSELINVKFSDLDLKQGWLNIVGKGKKQRAVPIGAKLTQALKDYFYFLDFSFSKKDKNSIFLTRLNKPFSRVSVWKLIKKQALLAHININIYPHILRHSFATHLLSNGADLRIVQALLGHTNLSTTKIYTHVKNEELKEMIELYHPFND